MEVRNAFSRTCFSQQTAKCLIFDGSVPFSAPVLHSLVESLENLMVVVSNLGGHTRIPLLSITTLTDSTETLLPIQHVRGNYSRIQCALDELKQILTSSPRLRRSRDACMEEGLNDVCDQFRRQVKTTMQTTGSWCQQEVIMFTCDNCAKVVRQIEKVVSSIDLEYLKVVAVCPDALTDDLVASPMSTNSDSDIVLSATGVTGVVDSLTLDSDGLSVEHYLRGWIHDAGSDSEHMHLILPASQPSGDEMVIKCDLSERILHPGLLPCTTAFNLTGGADVSATPSRAHMTVPVYKLQVVGTLRSTMLCDSVVFGMPMIAQPTSCWKMEWDELEKNQQSFQVLCSQLCETDQVLICRVCVPLDAPTTLPYHKPNITHTSPNAHYVILPSHNGMMLVKGLAVTELTIPCDRCPPADCVSVEVREEVLSSLNQVKMLTDFNPLTVSSDLYKTLRARAKKVQATKPLRHTPAASTAQTHHRALPSPQWHTTIDAEFQTGPGPTVNRRLFNRTNAQTNHLSQNKRFCSDSSQNLFPTEL